MAIRLSRVCTEEGPVGERTRWPHGRIAIRPCSPQPRPLPRRGEGANELDKATVDHNYALFIKGQPEHMAKYLGFRHTGAALGRRPGAVHRVLACDYFDVSGLIVLIGCERSLEGSADLARFMHTLS